ncbi:MAG: competence/damage-inducible protein A [Melioribacteraceae bacterium]|nr:competence/damage-inducible protein A [Melioribacteraceae bacterium]
MKIHIVTIGDEILIGQILNSNASYIGELLINNSYKITSSSTISDDEDAIINEIKSAMDKNDIVLCTGGLGPTHDDVTLSAIVKAFNTELVENSAVLNDIKELFNKRNRELTETNRKQALVPKIGVPIRNNNGTAPGIYIEQKSKIFAAMPGVPLEMKAMMQDFVLPKIIEKFPAKYFTKLKTLLTTGIPESFLFDEIKTIDGIIEKGNLAFLPSQFGVRIRITSKELTEEKANEKIFELEQQIRAKVGRYIYGRDEQRLEEVVGKLLKDRGLRIAIAESCTGGLISSRITNVGGSSKYFERAMITYSNGAKVEMLGIDEDLLIKYGAVSLEVARLMAEGIRGVSGTDIGLAVTGIMGPGGATENKPVGLVYIGICDENVCTAKEFRFGDNRLFNKDRTSQAALEMLRRNLLGISYDK